MPSGGVVRRLSVVVHCQVPEQTESDTVKPHVDWTAHHHALSRLTVLGMDVL